MMQKTLWYISKYFAPMTEKSPGGRGWFLMDALQKKGYKPVVITSDSNALIDNPGLIADVEIETKNGVDIVWLKTYKYHVAKSLKRILSWFHFEWNLFFLNKNTLPKPDAIVVSSLSLLSIVNGLWLKKKYSCRLIFEIRDIWPLTIVEEGGVSKYNPFVLFLSVLEKLGYKYSDEIIGTMPNLIQHVDSVVKKAVPVHCVPMGISSEHLSNQVSIGSDYLEEYLSDNKLKVVHAGTVGITNALDVFFETAKRLKDNEGIQFIIVGDGPLLSEYKRKFDSCGNIKFAPKVDRNQVQSVLSYADVVYFSVFPSKVWEYGQSLNKVIDYMLSGTPVLASYSGYPSMINEANCGYFVPSCDADALAQKLLEIQGMSPKQRSEIGARGKQWLMENRSYDKLADNFAKIVFEG